MTSGQNQAFLCGLGKNKKSSPFGLHRFNLWCPGPDSNRYEVIPRGILSPLRLPFRHPGTRLVVPRERLELSTP